MKMVPKLLNPKFSLKLAPNYTKDNSKIDNIINIDNIYSFNRYSEQDTVEGGVSLAYGPEYSVFDKNQLNVLEMNTLTI